MLMEYINEYSLFWGHKVNAIARAEDSENKCSQVHANFYYERIYDYTDSDRHNSNTNLSENKYEAGRFI